MNKNSNTLKNIQQAFAGESQAFIKYSYFAKKCREKGFDHIADVFEKTAKQEIAHAFGHLDLLMFEENLTPERCLEIAIEGEKYEYEVMYPKFKEEAAKEQEEHAIMELNEQIGESKEHAEMFISVLKNAEKKFNALTDVEKKHAAHYWAELKTIAE